MAQANWYQPLDIYVVIHATSTASTHVPESMRDRASKDLVPRIEGSRETSARKRESLPEGLITRNGWWREREERNIENIYRQWREVEPLNGQ